MPRLTKRYPLWLPVVGLCLALLPGVLAPSVHAEPLRNSRLSQLIQNRPKLYLPERLIIGQDNRFVIQAPAGQTVRLYVSPDGSGATAPNGQPLRVGTDYKTLEGVVPEKGVLTLTLPVPDQDDLEGKGVFVDGLTWRTSPEADAGSLDLMDASGRLTRENAVALTRLSAQKGAMVLPAVPGIPQQLIRGIKDNGFAGSAAKQPAMDAGQVDRDLLFDQNPFITRPGGMPTPNF